MSGTFISFDFGTKSIGVAIGQSIIGTAWPLTAIKVQQGKQKWSLIEQLLNKWQPDGVVVGLPLNMDNTEQILTVHARKFAYNIHNRFGFMVKLQDERLSTVEARVRLFKHGGFHALNKKSIDAISAVIILESFFRNENISCTGSSN